MLLLRDLNEDICNIVLFQSPTSSVVELRSPEAMVFLYTFLWSLYGPSYVEPKKRSVIKLESYCLPRRQSSLSSLNEKSTKSSKQLSKRGPALSYPGDSCRVPQVKSVPIDLLAPVWSRPLPSCQTGLWPRTTRAGKGVPHKSPRRRPSPCSPPQQSVIP